MFASIQGMIIFVEFNQLEYEKDFLSIDSLGDIVYRMR